jgi:hypothetical protein
MQRFRHDYTLLTSDGGDEKLHQQWQKIQLKFKKLNSKQLNINSLTLFA